MKDTDTLIASSGLHRIDWSVPKFEIGYWIDSRYSGKGYMTEAVKRIVQFAFEDLQANRLEICCDSNNLKSKRIPERIGFNFEGELKNFRRHHLTNELVHKTIYGLSRQMYFEMKPDDLKFNCSRSKSMFHYLVVLRRLLPITLNKCVGFATIPFGK